MIKDFLLRFTLTFGVIAAIGVVVLAVYTNGDLSDLPSMLIGISILSAIVAGSGTWNSRGKRK